MSCTERGLGWAASGPSAAVVVVAVAGLKTPWQVARRDRECGEEVVNRLQVGVLLDGGPVVEPALHGGEDGGEIKQLAQPLSDPPPLICYRCSYQKSSHTAFGAKIHPTKSP